MDTAWAKVESDRKGGRQEGEMVVSSGQDQESEVGKAKQGVWTCVLRRDNLFIKKIFIEMEHLLRAWHCSRHWLVQ